MSCRPTAPGAALVLNAWTLLTVPLVMYAILRPLVRKEEQYLEGKFGDQYRACKKRVPAFLPRGWMRGQ